MFDAETETDHSEYLEAAAECERGGFLIYVEGVSNFESESDATKTQTN